VPDLPPAAPPTAGRTGESVIPRQVTGQYGSPESPGRDNPEPDTGAHPTPDLTDDGWELTCYGDPVAQFDTLDHAISAANVHIRACPKGPMAWATEIEWHQTTLPELGGRYVSAARGEWLNHHLRHPAQPTGSRS
jgi:hypothetical protein